MVPCSSKARRSRSRPIPGSKPSTSARKRMAELLAIEQLTAGYGEAVVLSGLSLSLNEGQSLALLGRNGMGKTTLVNSIVGVTRYRGGTIRLGGRDMTHLRPDQRAHAGVGWVPQERNIFKSLTVEENLTAVERPGRWTVARIYELFPRLAERRRNLGNQLSGGEQQMLAVGRAAARHPRRGHVGDPGGAERPEGAGRHRPGGDPRARQRGL